LLAQDDHFIYVQTSDRQPFYVRISDKIISSTDYGYLTIPAIQSDTISFTIGFPKNKWPGAKYIVPIENKDHGYHLNLIDSIWGMYDFQTGELVEPVERYQIRINTVVRAQDEFSSVLSQVSNTPELNGALKTVDTLVNLQVQKTSKSKKTISQTSDDPALTSSASDENLKSEQISLMMNNADSSGFSSVYQVSSADQKDTIVIFIPMNPTVELKSPILTVTDSLKESDTKNPSDAKNVVCANRASEQDFLKLRRTMVLQETEQQMTNVAQASFQLLCYTTEQIKNLANLYLNEQYRLGFLKAAFGHLSDGENYHQLRNLLSNPDHLSVFDLQK
jgi:hypothetical protein